jgi:ankyrin repeat protein
MKTEGSTPLHLAAQNGHLDVVEFLVEQQAEVNAKETDGWTPLYLAAHNGHFDVVKFLVEQQAELNAKDIDDGRHCIQQPRMAIPTRSNSWSSSEGR